MNTIVIPLAFGDIYDQGGEGKMIDPPDHSTYRVDAVLKMLSAEQTDKYGRVLFMPTAGFGRKNPVEIGNGSRKVALARQMQRYILSRPMAFVGSVNSTCAVTSFVWSTRNEIHRAIVMALAYHEFSKPSRVVIASDEPHLRRIQLYVEEYLPEGWTAEFITVNYPRPIPGAWMEPLKLLRDRVIHWKWKQRKRRREIVRLKQTKQRRDHYKGSSKKGT